jgi:hypothetical protein
LRQTQQYGASVPASSASVSSSLSSNTSYPRYQQQQQRHAAMQQHYHAAAPPLYYSHHSVASAPEPSRQYHSIGGHVSSSATTSSSASNKLRRRRRPRKPKLPEGGVVVAAPSSSIVSAEEGDTPDDASGISHGNNSASKQTHPEYWYYSLRCGLVGTGPEGTQTALGRVVLTNWHHQVILDTLIKVPVPVIDYRSEVTGIHPGDPMAMNQAVSLDNARAAVGSIVQGKVLIGHGLELDLSILRLSHPWSDVRDTAIYKAFVIQESVAVHNNPEVKQVMELPRDLDTLAEQVLQRELRPFEPRLVDEAMACMDIYKSKRDEWEGDLLQQIQQKERQHQMLMAMRFKRCTLAASYNNNNDNGSRSYHPPAEFYPSTTMEEGLSYATESEYREGSYAKVHHPSYTANGGYAHARSGMRSPSSYSSNNSNAMRMTLKTSLLGGSVAEEASSGSSAVSGRSGATKSSQSLSGRSARALSFFPFGSRRKDRTEASTTATAVSSKSTTTTAVAATNDTITSNSNNNNIWSPSIGERTWEYKQEEEEPRVTAKEYSSIASSQPAGCDNTSFDNDDRADAPWPALPPTADAPWQPTVSEKYDVDGEEYQPWNNVLYNSNVAPSYGGMNTVTEDKVSPEFWNDIHSSTTMTTDPSSTPPLPSHLAASDLPMSMEQHEGEEEEFMEHLPSHLLVD